MTKRSKVQLYEQIRRVHEREKLSILALARRFGVQRREVRAALEVRAGLSRDKQPPVVGAPARQQVALRADGVKTPV